MKRLIAFIIACLLFFGCGMKEAHEGKKIADAKVLKIAAGSEIKELEPIIEEYERKFNRRIELSYMGSLDMMNELKTGAMNFDALWPASTIWLNMGDIHKVLKHQKSISITPIIFGIKKSKVAELGWNDKDIYIKDIIEAIEDDRFSFAMTSATQSNSGANAYLGFLTAIANDINGDEAGVNWKELQNPALRESITKLLSGVNRSSGSSNWLVDLFINGDYDAMVNYETLIIKTNNELEKLGREPLVAIYPIDGLVFSDAPLAFVSKTDNEKKEETFLEFQDYLLSDEVQDKIEMTGRRSNFNTVRDSNKKYFKSEWGLDPDKIISPIKLPDTDTIEQALSLYQTSFKKPAVTYYLLDYSGSMSGDGVRELKAALGELLIASNAHKNLLNSHPNDENVFVPFSKTVDDIIEKTGDERELEEAYNILNDREAGGSTAMYEALIKAIEKIGSNDYSGKNISIVVMTDGAPTDSSKKNEMIKQYNELNKDIPIFSILFGSANEREMSELAELSRGKVFDGRENLIKAFKDVKGYN
ncbi:MAG: VWA domain-containing protein [Firmicutes bacterium]|nr:VWA domain-containing protein [Bacillota bacterium]